MDTTDAHSPCLISSRDRDNNFDIVIRYQTQNSLMSNRGTNDETIKEFKRALWSFSSPTLCRVRPVSLIPPVHHCLPGLGLESLGET
jgi:hypothetical protein